MEKVMAFTGDEIAAEAMCQINPDVLAAYPITPQTETVQKFSEFVAEGVRTFSYECLCGSGSGWCSGYDRYFR